MDDERYKQIMIQVGMPDSHSLLAALKQVANEVEQEVIKREKEINVIYMGSIINESVKLLTTSAKMHLDHAQILNKKVQEEIEKIKTLK